MFKALADPTRLKIAYALMKERELCVCDLAHVLEATVAATSHHLRLMKNLDCEKQEEREGVLFLEDEHIQQILAMAMEHHLEDRGITSVSQQEEYIYRLSDSLSGLRCSV